MLKYENPREIEIQRAERARCVGLVLELFAQQRNFPAFAELLDDLANRMEHPELALLETAAREYLPLQRKRLKGNAMNANDEKFSIEAHPYQRFEVGTVFLRGTDYFRITWISDDRREATAERVQELKTATVSE